MRGHNASWIVDRIAWCARKHSIPYESTRYWSDAPASIIGGLPPDFSQPVIYSSSMDSGSTVIGVDELCVIDRSVITRINLDNLSGINHSGFNGDKLALNALCLTCEDGSEHVAPTEAGKPCYAIWGILNLLVKIKKSG